MGTYARFGAGRRRLDCRWLLRFGAPEHITAIRESLQDYSPGPTPELAKIEATLGLARAAPAHGRQRVRRSRRRR